MNSNKEKAKIYRRKHKEKIASERPWFKHWRAVYSRCVSPSHRYFQRGIKNKLTPDDMYFLWCRDNARYMKNPSIDRINTWMDYTIDNCRFIERIDNARRTTSRTDGMAVVGTSLKDGIQRFYLNVTSAAKSVGVSRKAIDNVIHNKSKTSAGCRWGLVDMSDAIKQALKGA